MREAKPAEAIAAFPGSNEHIIHFHGLLRCDQGELTGSSIEIAAWAGWELQYPLRRLWPLCAGT